MTLPRALVVFLALSVPGVSVAAPRPDPAEPVVLVGAPLRTLALPLSPEILDDLRFKRWQAAADRLGLVDAAAWTEGQRSDLAFVRAFALARAEKGAEAKGLLAKMGQGDAPAPYVAWVRGEVLRATGDLGGAEAALALVDDTAAIAPRAKITRADLLSAQKRPDEARKILEELVKREDPAEGNAEALSRLAKLVGDGTPEGKALLTRLWSAWPGTPESVEAVKRLGGESTPPNATWQDWTRRAERWADQSDWDAALQATERFAKEAAADRGEDGCRWQVVRGRAFYKKNQLSNAIAAFGDAGKRCLGNDVEGGATALYLQGTAEFRKGNHKTAAAIFERLGTDYPTHSFADDGWTQAGISLQEAGDLANARKKWEAALQRFPSGDTVPEATFRLAWSYYQDGDAATARKVAGDLGALPLGQDAVHVAAGRYWQARWTLYPDVKNPNSPAADGKEAAIAGWKALCEEVPHSFYAILAWSRLKEEAPEVAKALATAPRPKPDTSRPWEVRLAALDGAPLKLGVALARVGLITEAQREWSRVSVDQLTPDEMALLTELRIASGDWLLAHDAMRRWIWKNPIGTLGGREAEVVRVAYPDRYWDEVQVAAKGDAYEPRLFHALVREESNFNRTIKSHAGAMGLSQLMPQTAEQTAGWLGMKLASLEKLHDPETNLKIGAHYFDKVLGGVGGSPFLACAGYNAGSGRVREWLGEWGNVPTDEYVERIPFKETRGYVKRVMGTWQTMRWQFDEGDGFYDLSAFNQHAQPEK